MRVPSIIRRAVGKVFDPYGPARREECFQFLVAHSFPGCPPHGGLELSRGRIRTAPEPAALYLDRLRREGRKRELRFLSARWPWLTEAGRSPVREVEVAPADVEHFWQLAGEAGAWEWHGDHGPLMCDGYTWSLTMRRGGREAKCQGHELNGPPDGLSRLLLALGALAGRELPWEATPS